MLLSSSTPSPCIFLLSVFDDTNDDNDDDENMEGEDKALDTAILVFPPNSLDGGSSQYSAVMLITGEGTLSTPKGKCELYFFSVDSNTDLLFQTSYTSVSLSLIVTNATLRKCFSLI